MFSCVRKLTFNIFKPYISKRGCKYSDVTAGIIIIGDEILSGITTDINTPFLIEQLNKMGIKIRKIALVSDNVDDIALETKELSRNCTVVLTAGGIGPTHDDVTYEAVAKACNDELELNRELFTILECYFGSDQSKISALTKFAQIPKSAKLNYVNINHNVKKIKFPLVSVNNIFIFPGVPILLQKSFEVFKSSFQFKSNSLFTTEVYINLDEFSVTDVLNKTVELFKENVKFGSYPIFANNYYKVKLVLRSFSELYLKEVNNYLKQNLPAGSIVMIKSDILSTAKADVYSLCEDYPKISEAVSVIEESLRKYELSETCLCFNGGKDCTALLHLLFACIQKLQQSDWKYIHVLYIKTGETLREVENFIQNTVKLYNVHITILEGNLKEAVFHYLKQHQNIKAMFLGSRVRDPGALQHFSSTDNDWPSVIRILPILNWTYSDVWFFIRELQIPYCNLYDQGYTSLGNKLETIQNPMLIDYSKGVKLYKPAYMLDVQNERKSHF